MDRLEEHIQNLVISYAWIPNYDKAVLAIKEYTRKFYTNDEISDNDLETCILTNIEFILKTYESGGDALNSDGTLDINKLGGEWVPLPILDTEIDTTPELSPEDEKELGKLLKVEITESLDKKFREKTVARLLKEGTFQNMPTEKATEIINTLLDDVTKEDE
jgi:hypothetical protein